MNCGKEIVTYPSEIKRGKKACSRKCDAVIRTVPTSQRFSRYVQSTDPTKCWEWTGGTYPNGYGSIWDGERKALESAHRTAYRIHVGPIPEGMLVCHRCDNKTCCNPAHLFLGTPADNMADMHAKGRARNGVVYGEAIGNSKLTEADVRAIRANPNVSSRKAAVRYGVTHITILQIRRRNTWRHLP
jgi:hypothetical protein